MLTPNVIYTVGVKCSTKSSQQLIDDVGGQLNQIWINAHPVGYFCSAEIAFQQFAHLVNEFSFHVLYITP